ncbi:hypothetical protein PAPPERLAPAPP_01740 [Brevundimonas phage vB_BpoS-Papperlapapp]|uniref:Uncharacterized protein n=2 Tax=Marchewkavirus TaxID=3425052 RepID=A0A9E7MNT8_9CAUD|nr:hypothetical protein KABACHOK_00110 [Brevundimonas phage vB_BpoS-Kabachok]USN14545.1 hypothetical protein DOMOVOI_00700 [Brevundimonas phage vB_BpoS-Domovoi]USN15916.1 hypothetical protein PAPPERLAPAPP_01740 [Brevundimonas phage vB_BpoS-Papperlapapp]
MTDVKVNRRAPAPQTPPPQRVLHRAFDEFDSDYDPTDDYAEIAHKVRAEESAW